MKPRVNRITTLLALLLLIAGTGVAQGGRRPGAVLIYPIHRSGVDGVGFQTEFFTIVSVANTSTSKSTNLHYEYVNVVKNPANELCPLGCSVFDRIEMLTPADMKSVLTDCHNAFALGGSEGYLVISAQDPMQFNTPWALNSLVGSELVLATSGMMYSLNAIPVSAVPTGCQPTDINGNGQLDFDGIEYEQLPDQIIMDSYIALAASNLILINLTGSSMDKNTVLLSIWNDNEFALSLTIQFSCWFEERLNNISPIFDETFLRGLPNDPTELDLDCGGTSDSETGWVLLDSIAVHNAGGSLVSPDGVILGAITAGVRPVTAPFGRLLWESVAKQNNGVFLAP